MFSGMRIPYPWRRLLRQCRHRCRVCSRSELQPRPATARAPHLALVCSLGVERGEDPHHLLGLALWTSRPASGVLTYPLRVRELLAACFAAILVGWHWDPQRCVLNTSFPRRAICWKLRAVRRAASGARTEIGFSPAASRATSSSGRRETSRCASTPRTSTRSRYFSGRRAFSRNISKRSLYSRT